MVSSLGSNGFSGSARMTTQSARAYGARAQLLSDHSLDATIALTERWWRDERKAFQITGALGCGNRLSLDVLSELRLMLRIMRFKRMRAQFPHILTELRDQSIAEAAE
jgi:hypothetical protein